MGLLISSNVESLQTGGDLWSSCGVSLGTLRLGTTELAGMCDAVSAFMCNNYFNYL